MGPKKASCADIVSLCHSDKKQSYRLYYYHRLLSVPITKCFYFMGISPSFVSYGMLILSVASFGLMVMDGHLYYLIGLALSFFAFLLDKVDGDLARLYDTSSIKACVIDMVYHRVSLFLFYLGTGIHFSMDSPYLVAITSFGGFIANYIEEAQLAPYRIFSHKHLSHGEVYSVIQCKTLPAYERYENYFKVFKMFRVQLFLYYYVVTALILRMFYCDALFYMLLLAVTSMLIYSIWQLYYSMAYDFDKVYSRLDAICQERNL